MHNVNNHKKKHQLASAYRNDGWINPDLMNIINHVINDCKFYQKFAKSVCRPRISHPKATSFNEVVMLDIKEFGSKYVLQIIDIFTRFMQGVLISTKKLENIINSIYTTWNMKDCIPIGWFLC